MAAGVGAGIASAIGLGVAAGTGVGVAFTISGSGVAGGGVAGGGVASATTGAGGANFFQARYPTPTAAMSMITHKRAPP